MEFASLLAGERWSDHPVCAHPLLGQLARQVNDHTSDAGRQQLLPLIPSVVGRVGDDRTWVTLAVAVAARPILDVPETTQRVLAAGLVRAEQLCVQTGPELTTVAAQARLALELVPSATRWVNQFGVRDRINEKAFTQRCAPTMVRCAVEGIVRTERDCDRRLRDLLEVGIAACPQTTPPPTGGFAPTSATSHRGR